MKIIKIIISLTLFLLLTNVLQAQVKNKKQSEEKAKRNLEIRQNVEKLNLSIDQELTFIKILKRYAKKLKELRATNTYETEDLHQFRDLEHNRTYEIRKLLTDTQFNTFWKLKINFEKIE